MEKPEPVTLAAKQITAWNYLAYAGKYGATGITPPPLRFVTVSKTYGEHAAEKPGNFCKNEDLKIPDGYKAIFGFLVVDQNASEKIAVVAVIVGHNPMQARLSDPKTYPSNRFFWLDKETGQIPITILTINEVAYTAAIEIVCERTSRALEEWQITTRNAILQAYLKLQSDYEDKLAALAIQQGNQISGQNPDQNRAVERTELKKACISLLTAQHFDWVGGIEEGTSPGNPSGRYPQTDLSEPAQAQGRYIRFFEQAFEWDQMMYFFYPYYWGRKSKWYERVLMDDTDPIFAEFLKAGEARVVIPVRPGFEGAIQYFMETGMIWNGADFINIGSPLYVSIIEEIKESQKALGKEVSQGGTWDVRLPTTLVKLRPDDKLPEWEKDAQGNWVPV